MSHRLTYSYHQGEIVPAKEVKLHTDTEAFKFGNLVLDQAIACWSKEENQLYAFRLEDHCRRLWESMRITRLSSAYTPVQFEQASLALLEANRAKHQDVCIRFMIYKGLPDDGPDGVGFTIFNYGLSAESLAEPPVAKNVVLSSWTKLPDHVMPPRANSAAKHANARYASQEAAARGGGDALMLNWRGKVAEYTSASAFFVRQGKVVTPSITSDILEGITRHTCIQLLEQVHGIKVEEREVDPSELYVLDEAWQGDTICGLTPVVSIDHMPVGDGKPGPIYRQLRETFISAHLGQCEICREWCTPIAL